MTGEQYNGCCNKCGVPISGCICKFIKNPLEIQVGGNHYSSMKIQPLEFIMVNNIPFPEGNVIKYVCRWRSKNGVEDLKKARDYLDKLIEHEESK